MNEYEQAVQFVQGLQSADCCCCLTSLLALGRHRGLSLEAIMRALDRIRQENMEVGNG